MSIRHVRQLRIVGGEYVRRVEFVYNGGAKTFGAGAGSSSTSSSRDADVKAGVARYPDPSVMPADKTVDKRNSQGWAFELQDREFLTYIEFVCQIGDVDAEEQVDVEQKVYGAASASASASASA